MPQASPTAQNYDYSRFTSNDYLEFSTSLTGVLFCTLPPTSIVPGSQGRVASSTRDIEFEGPLDPQLLEGSFFDPQSQNTFKAFLQK